MTSNSTSLRMGASEWALLITLSILWGGSFFFVEVVLQEIPPLTTVLGRVGFAAVALLVIVHLFGLRMPGDLRSWGAFLIMGGLNNLIPFCLIVWGQTQIASGLAAILNATTPLFTILFAHFLTHDERMTPAKLLGVLLGLAGATVMIGPEALQDLGLEVLGQIAILGAAISYALAGIFGRRFRGRPPMVTATGQVMAATLLLAPVACFVEQPWTLPMPGLESWSALIALALASTAVAYLIYFRLLSTSGATNLLLVTFLVPVSAILLGTSILGERLDPQHFLGMALIGLGLAAIDGRPLSLLRRRRGTA